MVNGGVRSTLRDDGREHRGPYEDEKAVLTGMPYRATCGKCGARRVDAQIGLEPSIEAYVATMVQVFREVKRVLRDDGTVWVNMGDSYSAGGRGGNTNERGDTFHGNGYREEMAGNRKVAPPELGSKQLLGIPWRVAFALQADSWILRSDIVWSKPNPMPESVTDRPTKSHEYIFLLAKRERYFFDNEAVRERTVSLDPSHPSYRPNSERIAEDGRKTYSAKNAESMRSYNPAGRNARSVWSITPRPFAGAHFATFPSELVRRCIAAGTSERGQCPHCGTAWRRVVEKEKTPLDVYTRRNAPTDELIYSGSRVNGVMVGQGQKRQDWQDAHPPKTLGWRPGCTCPPHEPVPQVVFDPFGGAGTVPLVASNLGRRGVMTELSPAYIEIARRRIERPHAKPERVAREEHHPLFAGIDP